MDKSSISIGTWPTPEKPIQVHLPVKVAYDLKAMQKVTADILNRLGCPECHSGFDIRFLANSNFLVDEKLNVQEMAGEVMAGR